MLAGVFTLASKNTSAWFLNSIKTNEDVLGETKGAYFAYGNGTKDKPYGIKSPRHLYNLAWLQYLGYFNKENNHEVYFELADNISMEGWTLPPIGTTKYPFIGHFSGKPVTNNAENKTYTISNLTIANTKDAITEAKIPYAVKNSDDYKDKKELSNIDIVGLFGCVGDIKNYTGDTYYQNTDTETATIHNLNLSGINVTSQTTNTVAGIVAGYLDSTVDNIKISLATNCDSKLNISNSSSGITLGPTTYTDTSKYTSIGFCEEEYETSIDEQTNKIYQPSTTTSQTFTAGGNDNNWGGSLDMESFYKRVKSLQDKSSLSEYSLARKIVLDEDGNISSSSYDTSISNLTGTLYHYNSSEYESSYNPKIGALNLHNNGNDAFGLNGGSYVTSVTSTAYYISTESNYLSINSNNQLYNSTSAVTSWNINDDGTINTTINGVTYYLYDNDGNLEITQDSDNTTSWEKTTSGSNYLLSHNSNYLTFDTETSKWTLKEATGYPTFKIYATYSTFFSTETYYLAKKDSIDSSTGYYYFKTTETNSANAIIWNVGDSKISNGTTCYSLYTLIDSEKWYLTATTNSSKNKEFNLQKLTNLTDYNYFYITSSGLRPINSENYLRYDSPNGWGWCYGNSTQAKNTKVIIDGNSSGTTFDSILTNGNIANFVLTLTSTISTSNYQTGKWYYDFEDVTYLPLNVDSSTYEATDKNTGYLIGGSEETTSPSSKFYSNVRITNYGNKEYYLAGNNNYTDGSYTNVITNGGTPYTVIKDSSANFSVKNLTASDYVKYNDSVKSFRSNLSSSDGLYGFHFLTGSISINKIIKAKKAYILGNEYDNYEMPANSVDFNLKSKGYINFYSGTYTKSSTFIDNSFFSIHEIIRDENNKILEIREISKIYKANDNSSNAYLFEYVSSNSNNRLFSAKFNYISGERKYSNNQSKKTLLSLSSSESKNYLSNYDEIFDTEQLGNRNSTLRTTINKYVKNIFYFEIPVNDGEYCLGSVEGGNGAYLMYLDIGTNASTISRTTILEQFVQTNVSFTYPTGIVYYYDEKENYICLNIPKNYSGTTTIQYNNSLNINNTNSSVTPKLTYDSSLALVSTNLTNVNIDEGIKGTITTIQRLTYIDYNTNDGTTTKIVATKENGGSNSGKYYTLEDGAWVETTADKVTIYQVGEDNVGSIITIEEVNVSYTGETVIFTFRIDGKDITISYDLSVDKSQTTSDDGSSIYYDDGNYTITFEVNNTTITLTLTKNNDGTYTPSITGGTITKNSDGTYSIVI